jgi:hypothetical protein
MHRFWTTIRGVITSIIVFCSCLVGPADALVVRDLDTCISFCIIQFNRHGDVYAWWSASGFVRATGRQDTS